MNTVSRMTSDVRRFAEEVLDLPIPYVPCRLSHERKAFAIMALNEELSEYMEASSLEDEADALIDLTYFALGRLVEMGITPGGAFDEVQRANLGKVRGRLAKRGNSGYDAVKPSDWTPPELGPFVSATKGDVLRGAWRPKILVIGHARHGKDTTCEIMRDHYGLRFTSSSWFCAERVMFPLLSRKYGYETVQECFDDRHNHRAEWYNAIRNYNSTDPTRLARGILEENDIYCGLRAREELMACEDAGLFDAIVWVDRSEHVEPEPESSCTVTRAMADYTLDNNGSHLGHLEMGIGRVLRSIWGKRMVDSLRIQKSQQGG